MSLMGKGTIPQHPKIYGRSQNPFQLIHKQRLPGKTQAVRRLIQHGKIDITVLAKARPENASIEIRSLNSPLGPSLDDQAACCPYFVGLSAHFS